MCPTNETSYNRIAGITEVVGQCNAGPMRRGHPSVAKLLLSVPNWRGSSPREGGVATRMKVPGAVTAALAVSAALLLAGCTSSSVADPSSTPSTSTSTLASMSSPSSRAPTSTPVTSSSAVPIATPTSANPWPADLTPEQITQAQAAIAAYVGYYKLVDQAYATPGDDWAADAAKWATDPVKTSFLNNLAGTAALGQYRAGTVAVYPTVTKVEPGLVTMSVCVDSTNAGFFDKTGASIKAPDAPGTYFRHVSEVQVAQYEGGQWLVTFITDDYTTTC